MDMNEIVDVYETQDGGTAVPVDKGMIAETPDLSGPVETVAEARSTIGQRVRVTASEAEMIERAERVYANVEAAVNAGRRDHARVIVDNAKANGLPFTSNQINYITMMVGR